MAFVDPNEFAARFDVSIFSEPRLQRRIQSRCRGDRLSITAGIAGHGQRFQSNARAVMYMRLVSLFGSDLNASEDRRV